MDFQVILAQFDDCDPFSWFGWSWTSSCSTGGLEVCAHLAVLFLMRLVSPFGLILVGKELPLCRAGWSSSHENWSFSSPSAVGLDRSSSGEMFKGQLKDACSIRCWFPARFGSAAPGCKLDLRPSAKPSCSCFVTDLVLRVVELAEAAESFLLSVGGVIELASAEDVEVSEGFLVSDVRDTVEERREPEASEAGRFWSLASVSPFSGSWSRELLLGMAL